VIAWLFPLGFLAIGGGMIALALKARRRRARWEAAATRASGEVTDLRWQSVERAGDRNLLAFPVLRFSLPDGRTVETQSSWGTNPPQAKPGAQVTPLLVFVAWFALLQVIGFGIPPLFVAAAAIYVVVYTVVNAERLRVDEQGVRVRPAARIPWEHIQSVTARGPHELGVRLKPGSPLPRGIRGMIDGEVTLPARGFELDQARLDQAVRAYSEAGGSFSGMPGSGASSSGMSAGGPSG
jgi:hypothetical protein